MKTLAQIFISLILFCCCVYFTGCNKEKPLPQQAQQQSQHKLSRLSALLSLLTGTLDAEPITLQTAADPYTKQVDEDEQGQNDDNNDNDNGNANSGAKSMMVSGSSWQGGNLAATPAGSIEIRTEVFRIYVTPFKVHGYYNSLSPGTYSFATPADTANGAYMAITDQSGTKWTTMGDQTGSTFTISSRGQAQQNNAQITGTVNCKMYDANGNVKSFTSGSFSTKMGI